MPLVRIALRAGKSAEYRRAIGEVAWENWFFGEGRSQYTE